MSEQPSVDDRDYWFRRWEIAQADLAAAVEAEREACAEIAHAVATDWRRSGAKTEAVGAYEVLNKIRARTGPSALAERDAMVRREALEEAAKAADKRCMLPGDCEHLGSMDWETGARECALEMRDETCPCWERADEAEKIRDAIRALKEADDAAA